MLRSLMGAAVCVTGVSCLAVRLKVMGEAMMASGCVCKVSDEARTETRGYRDAWVQIRVLLAPTVRRCSRDPNYMWTPDLGPPEQS